jgi:DNA-binding CsgD family transcriptional regulator
MNWITIETQMALFGLTHHQREIVRLVLNGYTNQEIAAGMFIQVQSIKDALTRVYRDTGARGRTDLFRVLHGSGDASCGRAA